MKDYEQKFQEWLATRPPAIQELAHQFPPSTRVLIDDVMHYVLCYSEYDPDEEHPEGGVGLGVTPYNPGEDYERALENQRNICPCCMKKLRRVHQS